MTTPFARSLRSSLYHEHLAEASFLYQQRATYLHDHEVNWTSLDAWEQRIEAHIDALVIGGELALDTCRARMSAGDPGELHAALRVFCRQDCRRDALDAVAGLEASNDDAVEAARSALCAELPPAWREDIVREFDVFPQRTRLYAHVLGYRRIAAVEPMLLRRMSSVTGGDLAAVAWALGRIGTSASWSSLTAACIDADAVVREAAALALMRLGDGRIRKHALERASTETWAQRVLGIGGDPQATHVLLRVLEAGSGRPETVEALGLIGDGAAIVPLLCRLEDPDIGAAAGDALNTITGARLYDRTFVPHLFDPDELNDHERQLHARTGTLPSRFGQPFGSWERSVLRDPARWREWLSQSPQQFYQQQRWRMGALYGPAALVACLRCDTTPHAVRSAVNEELTVRFRSPIPFEVDLTVKQQTRILRRLVEWAEQASTAIRHGHDYFHGRLQQ